MAPSTPRLRVLSVGGNPLSAFLSWRLQATHSCDVTLVWKATYETVAQYGISFRSNKFGNERFKPHSVVRTPEEAGTMPGGFDYVLLSVKALPDVYDLASIIESVVTPQHTCILVNTSSALGTEFYLESRYPTNVVLSLVSSVSLTQTGTSEFEHMGDSDIWVGSAITNANVPESIQYDMAEALALTLASGNVDCHVSTNIRQQQWERVMGPIAFHPLSIIMDTPSISALMEKSGCKKLIDDLIDELLSIAKGQNCIFPADFKEKITQEQLQAPPNANVMQQDYLARRPLEIETFLGSPIKAGKLLNVATPRLETLYPILHNLNQLNQNKPPPPPVSPNPSPRGLQAPPLQGQGPRPGTNGMPARRPPPAGGRGMDPAMGRRPPPGGRIPPNGYPPRQNGDGRPTSNAVSRRNSFDDDLEEFGHIALYGDMVDDMTLAPSQDGYGAARSNGADLALRERELVLREREHMLRQQEIRNAGGGGGGGGGGPRKGGRRKILPSRSRSQYGDDDDDDDDGYYVDRANIPPMPPVDVDNLDMMSVTSRRNRRAPSSGNMRNQDVPIQPTRGGGRHSLFSRPPPSNRAGTRLMSDVPGLHESITNDPLMGYSSNRYGTVDRKAMTDSSRANSLSSQYGGGAYPPMGGNRRTSQQQGPNGFGPSGHPPNGYSGAHPNGHPNGHRNVPPNSAHPNGNANGYPPDQRGYRGSPDGPIRQPAPKYPPGPDGFANQVAQHTSDGVSHSQIMKRPPSNTVRSTTGSASASISNESGSVSTSGDRSAYSSTSSLEKRMPRVAVR